MLPIVDDLDNFKADIAFLGIPFGTLIQWRQRRYCERVYEDLIMILSQIISFIGEAKDVARNIGIIWCFVIDYESFLGPITLVQVDAHIDWRDFSWSKVWSVERN